MKSVAYAALALALGGGIALADVPAGTDWSAKLIEALEKNGCRMSEEEAATLLMPLGFEREWTFEVVQPMIAAGTLATDDENRQIVLKTGACAG